jgi:tetratricopeptide (TPR) repeat protein
MSLLLDALKKAALEKQRRENPNDVKMPAPTPPLLQAGPLALEEELDFNLDEIEIAPEPAAKKVVVDAVVIEKAVEQKIEIGKEIAIEADEEIGISPVASFLKKQVIENSKIQNIELVNTAAHKIPEQKPIEPLASPSIQIASPSIQPASPPSQQASPVNPKIPTQDSSVEIRKIVQEFDAASGKEALLQLLDRSKKAAKHARKRMIMVSAVLIVTSVTLVLGYFFLLRGSSVALVAPTASLPASPSPQMLPATEALGEAPSELENDTQILGASPAVVSNQQVAELIDEAGNKNELINKNELGNKNENETISENINSIKTKIKPALSPKNMLPTSEDMNRSESLPADKQVSIISRQPPLNDPISDAIQRGYQAYQNGDLKLADTAYRDALEQDANNRDALLGAAAVAVREGRQQDALGFYQRRLARAPKDDYAQAGVVSLSATSEANPELDAELSRLLREYPEASHLHFLKGSLLAARQQWAAAQLAFFEAWQRDNKNPELAFNLAVALDHLNQPKEAARFYQQAISLGNSRPVNFSVDDVRRRLEAIEVKTP